MSITSSENVKLSLTQAREWYQYLITQINTRPEMYSAATSATFLCLGLVPWYYARQLTQLARQQRLDDDDEKTEESGDVGAAPHSNNRRTTVVPFLERILFWKRESVKTDTRHFAALLRVAIPSSSSSTSSSTPSLLSRMRLNKHTSTFLLLTVSLVLRTLLSLRMATVTGDLVRAVVEQSRSRFLRQCVIFALLALIASFVNTGIRWSAQTLRHLLSHTLTRHFHRHYFQQDVFYRIVMQTSENRVTQKAVSDEEKEHRSSSSTHREKIVRDEKRSSVLMERSSSGNAGSGSARHRENADRLDSRLVRDVPEWASQVVTLYLTICKPILDVVVLSWKLQQTGGGGVVGAAGPALLVAYFVAVSGAVQQLAPSFGALISAQLSKDNALSEAWRRLDQDRFAVQLLRGEPYEIERLNQLFDEGNAQAVRGGYAIARFQLLDSLFVRNGSLLVGFGACVLLLRRIPATDAGGRAAAYSAVLALLTSLLRAVGQLVLGYRTISTVQGLTRRVYALQRLLTSTERTVKQEERVRRETDERLLQWQVEQERIAKRSAVHQGSTSSSSVVRTGSQPVDTLTSTPTASRDGPVELSPLVPSSSSSHRRASLSPTPNQETRSSLNDHSPLPPRDDVTPTSDSNSPLSSAFSSAFPPEDRGKPLTLLSSYIAFEQVTIATPSSVSSSRMPGRVLCEQLTFAVKPGMNVLIVGPNGCGKSSTFRTLAGLWPHKTGIVRRPAMEELFYVPQRPYLVPGASLRAQLVYPTRVKQLCVGESELLKILQLVKLETLFDRPGVAWDTIITSCETDDSSSRDDDPQGGSEAAATHEDSEVSAIAKMVAEQIAGRLRKQTRSSSSSVPVSRRRRDGHKTHTTTALSPGERQRLALARLLFHRPKFAILDECTSTLDEAMEAAFYRTCQQRGITVLSIGHRTSLWAYHNCVLRFDGMGGYQFSPFRVEVESTLMGGETHDPCSKEEEEGAVEASPLIKNRSKAVAVRRMILTKIMNASDASLVGTSLPL